MRNVARTPWYYGWTLLGGLGVISIVAYGTLQYLFGVLVVPVGQELGWTRTELSLSYSGALLVSGLLGYPIGRWVDRHGARAVLVTGAGLGGLTLLALARVEHFWTWCLLWGGGLGVAGALTQYPVSFTVVANWFHRRRGTALAWLTVLGGLASPIFLPLTGWLVPRIGWRHTLSLCGLLQWGVALPLALGLVRRHPEDVGLVPDGVPTRAALVTPPNTGVSANHALRRLAFWTLTLTILGAQAGSNVLVAHQVAYMIDRGQDPARAALLAGLVGVSSLPGRYVFNALSDRVPAQCLLGVAQLVLACGVGLLGLARSTGGFLAYVCIYGAAFGTTGGLAASVRADHFGRRSYGTISALQGYPALAGAAVGPLLAGWFYDRSGSYALTWIGVAALYLASALAMFATPKPPSIPGG